jgi:methylenetetrahydrofolate dehydrogenase (NAD+)
MSKVCITSGTIICITSTFVIIDSVVYLIIETSIRFVDPKLLNSTNTVLPPTPVQANDVPPPGTLKSILPCTPLAIIKCLEYAGVYNQLLKYGNRAFGKTITVINRSEVVGRPLAALLANDGARVFSVDIDSIQEYTKRPKASDAESNGDSKQKRTFHPSHVVHSCSLTLAECLALSDAVVSAVPSLKYKVSTDSLKDGCIAVNVAGEKNFEETVREKVSSERPTSIYIELSYRLLFISQVWGR